MKRIAITLLGIFSTTVIFSQATGKIVLSNGQKINVQSNVSIEASLSPGMELTSTSVSDNMLEVKNTTEKGYTISSTITKLKVNMNMMGQSTNYDSENKQPPASDIEKALAEKMNKPVDVVIDKATGEALVGKKTDKKADDADDSNPMEGMLNMFADNTDDAVVSGAFELIPAGKNTGDNWADSSISKETKTVRNYTLKSLSGNEATIQVDAVTNSTNKLDLQGMEIEFKSETKTSSEVITDIKTGQVKKKTTQSNITGSFQLMGQEMPITAKATSTSTYQ